MKKILFISLALLSAQMLFGQDRLPLSHNGSLYFEGDQPITKKELRQIISKDPIAFDKFKRSKRLKTVGWTMALTGLVFSFPTIEENSEGESVLNVDNPVRRLIFACGGLVGCGLVIGGIKSKERSIIFYNRNVDATSGNTSIVPTYNGLSITHIF